MAEARAIRLATRTTRSGWKYARPSEVIVRKVHDAATRLAPDGGPLSDRDIAAEAGVSGDSVRRARIVLRDDGNWKWTPAKPGWKKGKPRRAKLPESEASEVEEPPGGRPPDAWEEMTELAAEMRATEAVAAILKHLPSVSIHRVVFHIISKLEGDTLDRCSKCLARETESSAP